MRPIDQDPSDGVLGRVHGPGRPPGGRRAAAIAGVALALAGCVVVDEPPTVMCETSADCDSGEVCGENVCWGNPPSIALAATLAPPSTAAGAALAPSEVAALAISPTGEIPNLAFARSVVLSGRVVLSWDPRESLAARLIFSRPSRVPGAPAYVVTTISTPGAVAGAASYSVRLPVTDPADASDRYVVMVYPDDGTIVLPDDGSATAAEKAPPGRFETTAAADRGDLDFALGDQAGLKTIKGRVVDALGVGVPDMRVRAEGRSDWLAAFGPASTQTRTDSTGGFTIYAPIAWMDTFDVQVTPADSGALPTVTRRGVFVEDPVGEYNPPTDIGEIRLPGYPAAQDYQLPIVGWDGNGFRQAPVGATVRFFTDHFGATADDIDVEFEASGIVDADGFVNVRLIPGLRDEDRPYTVEILPPPDSRFAMLTVDEVLIGAQAGTLSEITVPARVSLRGRLFADDGLPAAGCQVQAQPSYVMLAQLALGDGALEEKARQMSWPRAAVGPDGSFDLRVDPALYRSVADGETAGTAEAIPLVYDLEFVPPASSSIPYWSEDGVDPSLFSEGIGDYFLPHPSNARGIVVDDAGQPVAGATVRIYEVAEEPGGCQAAGAGTCEVPARLRGLTRSDDQGRIHLVLPSPQRHTSALP